MAALPLDPDARMACLRPGIELFNRGEFFPAHEVWEDAWRDAAGDERRLLQGLIQFAVALEHARRGNLRGAARMAERYPAKFDGLPPNFMGVDLEGFLGQMDRAMRTLGTARGPAPRVEWLPSSP
jgi:hypothetical protein